MSNDDSLNDCDEVFSLYSSKKVTDTFKAQLKKIAASTQHLADPFSNVNNDEDFDFEKLKNNESYDVASVNKVQKKNFKVSSKSTKVIEDCASNTSVVTIDDEPLEDSIEIISDFTPRSTRQSERLRKKRTQGSLNPSQCWSNNENGPTKKRTGRKRSKRNKQQEKKFIDEVTIEDSPKITEIDDELNPEMTVKVIWQSVNMKKFFIRKFQKLSYIFELLAKEENIPENKIILTFNNIRVNRNDTPDSLNLQVYHFLDGGVLSELSNSCQTPNSQKPECDDDSVTLKFQDVNKKVVKVVLNKNEKLKVGMIKCSEQLEIPVKKIKFYFDGELLQPSETPASLGLENEEIIDIKISS